MNIILLFFSIKYKGDWDKIYKALEEKERVSLKEVNELENEIKNKKWEFITILDSNYPKRLKSAYKPPFVIWLKGNSKLLEYSLICISGEETDDSTKKRLTNFMPEIHKSNRIVIGHYSNFGELIRKHSEEVIYIGAEGLDNVKHPINKGDLLISEYPYGVTPKKTHFGNRNRIISAFAESLILLNSKVDSGINSLINAFLNQGKEIYCFPGSGEKNDGNSELIKNGANLITTIKDISS